MEPILGIAGLPYTPQRGGEAGPPQAKKFFLCVFKHFLFWAPCFSTIFSARSLLVNGRGGQAGAG